MSKIPSDSVGKHMQYLWQSPGIGNTCIASVQSLSLCFGVVVSASCVVASSVVASCVVVTASVVVVVGPIGQIGAVPTHLGFSGSYVSPLANPSLTLYGRKKGHVVFRCLKFFKFQYIQNVLSVIYRVNIPLARGSFDQNIFLRSRPSPMTIQRLQQDPKSLRILLSIQPSLGHRKKSNTYRCLQDIIRDLH